ncbi:hypothetical protein HDU87_003520 [Geranomyces variabilis]|uniref:Fungal lipase-type domain-containing protein n=1 Tax=Geranomyces variabilis TaxID=109894 RepID=A0AAD5XSI3_9FUNG|nr:hypothetical protein HDU87_003520 [Geranomyces variabilis]
MVQFRNVLAFLALTALGADANRGNVQRRAAAAASPAVSPVNTQAQLAFLSDILGRPATPDMIANLDAAHMNSVIKTEVAKSNSQGLYPENTVVSALETKNPPKFAPAAKRIVITGDRLANINAHALYAAAAYCANGLSGWTCGDRCAPGIKVVSTFKDPNTDTVAYVGYNAANNEILVVYRGTSSIRSAITDAKFWKADATQGLDRLQVPSGAKVHSGFLAAANIASDFVHQSINTILTTVPGSQDWNLSVVGHSLGGAISILSAVELLDYLGDSWNDKISVYTYGQPRTGNQVWAEWVETLPFASRISRTTHTNDIVPHVPPTLLSFMHHQTETWIDSNGALNTCSDSTSAEAKDCANSEWLYSIDAHLAGYSPMPMGAFC